MESASQEAAIVWGVYADEFRRRWGIDRDVAAVVGARSKSIFSAEFSEHGAKAYKSSVVLPIRNAFYAASVIDGRWERLSAMGLVEPVLDYGCGVGLMLVWMKRHGLSDLYGYEVPGIQKEVMLSVLERHNIKEWKGEPVETVTCFNVLEHVKEPVALLTMLMGIGKKVIANICTGHDGSHIAPHSKLEECGKILAANGGLFS